MLFLAFDTGQVWKAAFVVPSYVYQAVHWNVGQLQPRLPCLQFSPGGVQWPGTKVLMELVSPAWLLLSGPHRPDHW